MKPFCEGDPKWEGALEARLVCVRTLSTIQDHKTINMNIR